MKLGASLQVPADADYSRNGSFEQWYTLLQETNVCYIHPVADGYACYVLDGEHLRPVVSNVHYFLPAAHIRGLTLDDVLDNDSSRRSMYALFG